MLAYGWWGSVVPVYFWWLREVSAMELLVHRVIWGLPLLAALITVGRRWSALGAVLRSRRALRFLALSTCCIALNWLGFIYAIVTARATEASLGYFITPLVNVALGTIVLRERLRRPEWAALALAASGVAWLTIAYGELPWLALGLAISFGVYGLLRKIAPVESVTGLSVEMMLVFPFALTWLAWEAAHGGVRASMPGPTFEPLLLGAGVITVVPLVLFIAATRRLRLTSIGFLQYIAPTGQLLLAVFLFKEPFTTDRLVAFSLIWLALVVCVVPQVRSSRVPAAAVEIPCRSHATEDR